MTNFNYFKLTKFKKIRYLKHIQKNSDYIVFLHGFMSNLEGKKPKAFLNFAKRNKLGFLALEYSGHGKSFGKFTNGNISKWTLQTNLLIKKITLGQVIQKTNIQNLDIIGSHVNLSGLEVETANDSKRAFVLKEILSSEKSGLLKKYDNIFIDCPPSLSLLTIMSLVASDELLVPLQTEFFALEGITQLVKTIDRIKENLNPTLSIRGILLTMFDKRNKLSSEVDKEARNYFKDKVYKTVIQRNVRLSEAPSHGLPCVIYDKSCVGSKSYFKLAEEFKNKIVSAV